MRITIELGRPRQLRRTVALIAALALAVGGAGVVTASHLFDDVPTSSTFHTPIAAIARAGLTVGCGGGNFCPDSTITRGQEAALLHRGLSRVAMYEEAGPVVYPVDDGGPFTVGEVVILVPGSTALGIGANQFVKVDARVTWGSNCPAFSIELHADAGAGGRGVVDGYTTSTAPVSLSTTYVFAASPGQHTYYLLVRATACPTSPSAKSINMIATTHTFGDTGTDVLHCQNGLGCPSLAGRSERIR